MECADDGARNDSTISLAEMPAEILVKILLSFVADGDVATLLAVASVNKRLRGIVRDPFVWGKTAASFSEERSRDFLTNSLARWKDAIARCEKEFGRKAEFRSNEQLVQSEPVADDSCRIGWFMVREAMHTENPVILNYVLGQNHTVDINHVAPLREEDAKTFAEALCHNRRLQVLSLNYVQIGGDGKKAIINALQHNQSLQQLDLSGSYVGVEEAKAIANALQHNQSLRGLYLTHNNIGDAGKCALRECVAHRMMLFL